MSIKNNHEPCRLKFIDSFRFMNRSFSSLVDDLAEIHNVKCNDYKNNL